MTEQDNQQSMPFIEDSANQVDEWEIDNLPNRLTIFRMLLIPVIIGSLFMNMTDYDWIDQYKKMFGYIAAWTFVLASVTDFFDGYFARKRGIVTVFGSFLDPIADKFLVVSSLILLQGLGRIPVLIVIILVLREMYITSLRLLASDRGLTVPVGQLGKWKTAFQMIGIPFLMAYDRPWGIPMPLLGTVFIYLASIISMYSALEYSIGLVRKIQTIRKNRNV
ncbi:MAG: CDP-diacylglycerol--glycerol-3-phosphate 3-phosphatidyltransferase [Oligoflexia bacterium]|nr:CDP-diacylglycerol--glycerol-3-phosphate 3-phosphatidyltransferase [Oligoflexia bacterium]